jgi:site-specific recombinase XerD
VRTWRSYLDRLDADLDVTQITTAQLLNWMADHDWSASTRASARSALKSFFGWMVDAGLREDNPSIQVKPVRVPPRPAKRASDEAVRDHLSRLSGQDRLILLLAGFGGLRRSEISNLHSADVDDGFMLVKGKGGKYRRVPIHPALEADLADAVEQGGWVIKGAKGGKATPDAVSKRLRRATGLGAHSLRHRFATSVYRSSHDLRAVQELLGHSSVATTQRYVGVNEDDLTRAIMSMTA